MEKTLIKPSKVIIERLSDEDKLEYILNSCVSQQLKNKANEVFYELDVYKYSLETKRLKDIPNKEINIRRKQKAILIGELNRLYENSKVLNMRYIDRVMGEDIQELSYKPLFKNKSIIEEDKIYTEITNMFSQYEEGEVFI